MTTENTIKELEAQLLDARRRLADEESARRESVKPVWKFTFKPCKHMADNLWQRISRNSGIVAYFLEGEITNREALVAAGNPPDRHREGGMSFLVNVATPTPKIVKADGSGRVFWACHDSEFLFRDIEELLKVDLNGGDITEAVTALPSFRWVTTS